jgi:hypothetical protein
VSDEQYAPYEVFITDAPADAKTVIGESLAAYNEEHAGIDDRQDADQ